MDPPQQMISSTNTVTTMYPTVIDTLRFADRLKAAGFDDPQAEGMARALGDELADNMVTKRDLDEAVQSLRLAIEAMDAKFEARFDGLEPRFDAMDAKFEARFDGLEPRFDGLEPRFDAMDAKFDGLEPRFDAIDAKFDGLEPRFDAIDAKFDGLEPRFDAIDARFQALEPRFDAIDAKLESQHREFSTRFNVLFGTMALGFTLIVGLIGYSLFSLRPADPVAAAVEHHTAEVRLR